MKLNDLLQKIAYSLYKCRLRVYAKEGAPNEPVYRGCLSIDEKSTAKLSYDCVSFPDRPIICLEFENEEYFSESIEFKYAYILFGIVKALINQEPEIIGFANNTVFIRLAGHPTFRYKDIE